MKTLKTTDGSIRITSRERCSDPAILHITGMSPKTMTLGGQGWDDHLLPRSSAVCPSESLSVIVITRSWAQWTKGMCIDGIHGRATSGQVGRVQGPFQLGPPSSGKILSVARRDFSELSLVSVRCEGCRHLASFGQITMG